MDYLNRSNVYLNKIDEQKDGKYGDNLEIDDKDIDNEKSAGESK